MPLKQIVFVMAVFAAVYPTLTVGLMIMSELAPDLALPVRTALTTGIMVPTMTLLVIPAIRRMIDRAFA
ncbi:MAG: hypothetical protein AAFQ75_03660 [Pseudomonadota bacterium]